MLLSKIIKTEEINWQQARWLQNESLKELDTASMSKLKQSLLNNAFVMPFHVWDDGEGIWILDGHHRQKALLELTEEGQEIAEKLPATFIDCTNKKEAAKLVLIYSSAYAKIQHTGLDEFLTNFELSISELEHQIDLPDFSFPRFEQNFSPYELEEKEAEPIIDTNIIVQSGDMFQLGEHKLYCGDCTNKEAWQKMLGDQKADIVHTDPPYNLAADFITNKDNKRHKDFSQAYGEMTDEEFMLWLRDKMTLMCVLTKEASFHYIWMDHRHAWHMTEAAREPYGSVIPKQICTWRKSNGANGSFYRARQEHCYIFGKQSENINDIELYLDETEWCFIFKNGKGKHYSKLALKDRVRYNVWDYPISNSLSNPDRNELKNHPTPKPVQMVMDAIVDVTKEHEIVLDFFLGSGTALIAAEQSNRICYGTEISATYCQSIIKRYIRHCEKNGKVIEFQHLNGNLKLEQFNKNHKEP